MGCHALLQGIFPTQGLNLGLLPLQADYLLPEPESLQKTLLIPSKACCNTGKFGVQSFLDVKKLDTCSFSDQGKNTHENPSWFWAQEVLGTLAEKERGCLTAQELGGNCGTCFCQKAGLTPLQWLHRDEGENPRHICPDGHTAMKRCHQSWWSLLAHSECTSNYEKALDVGPHLHHLGPRQHDLVVAVKLFRSFHSKEELEPHHLSEPPDPRLRSRA